LGGICRICGMNLYCTYTENAWNEFIHVLRICGMYLLIYGKYAE
jgi:hypothetical protein